MQLQIERGKNANAKFEWIDFAVKNNDIASTLNQEPLRIRKISENKYYGKIWAAETKIEHIQTEKTSKRGYLRMLVETKLPFNLGSSYAICSNTYYYVDENITSVQFNIEMELHGLISIYAHFKKKAIDNYVDNCCSNVENAAQLLESNDEKITRLLDKDQQKRIEDFRKQLSRKTPYKTLTPSVEASLTISMVNKTMLVEADATMPDKHFLSGRNEIPHEPDSHQKIKASALQLAAINNPAFTVRGEKNPESLDIEFRQAAFEFGHNLYKNYFTNKLSEVMPVLLHYENNAFMKLDIDESVEGLPWEALHDGKNFLSTKLCFSRVLGAQGSRRAHKQINFENIGILLVGSDSRGDLPGVTSEVQNIAAILSDTGFSRVELLDGLKANRKNLLELLKSGEFNILHYSGHSVFNSSYPYQSYLEFIKSERLFLHELDDFSNQGLELVFLNSCQSGKTGLDQTTGRELSMCRTIRESGVANVIGMLWNVSDDAAAHFASEFYGFLSGNDQLHVAEAIRQTRCKVAMERAWQDGSWLAPILYT